MIQIDRHIEILLLSNDCVTVPGLGGFMAHHVDARFDDTDNQFLPPQRTLGFNPKLTLNDNLLAHSYIEAYDLSYPDAIERIEEEVELMKHRIEDEGFYELADIGTLVLNEEGNYEFTPCEAGILTPELYGLSSFEVHPISSLRPALAHTEVRTLADNQAAEEAEDSFETGNKDGKETISIPVSVLRNALAIAAAILAFFLITTPLGSDKGNVQLSNFDLTALTSLISPKESPHQQPVVDAKPSAKPTVKSTTPATQPQAAATQQPATSTHYWSIVLASGVTREGADHLVGQLSQKGFAEGGVLEKKGNSRKVVYGHYANANEAYNTLATLRSNPEFREAWILEVK